MFLTALPMNPETEDSVQFEPFIAAESGRTSPKFMPKFMFGFQKEGTSSCEKYYKGPIQSPFPHEQTFQLEALLAKFRTQTFPSGRAVDNEPSLPLFSKRFPRRNSRITVLSPLCVENQLSKPAQDSLGKPSKAVAANSSTSSCISTLPSTKPMSKVGKRLASRRKKREDPKSGQLLKKKKKRSMHLLCNHCMKSFLAKPTYRKRFEHYLINHSCYGAKRIQYVIGRKHRSCTAGCSRKLGCIRFDITKGPVPT
jgi:hypothetical protein